MKCDDLEKEYGNSNELSDRVVNGQVPQEIEDSLKELNSPGFAYMQADYFKMGINDRGAKAFSDSLKVNKSLVFVSFASNCIRDQGAKEISAALKVNTTITVLILGANKITSVGAQDLYEALTVNKTILYLQLDWDKVGKECEQKIKDVLKERSDLLQKTIHMLCTSEEFTVHLSPAKYQQLYYLSEWATGKLAQRYKEVKDEKKITLEDFKDTWRRCLDKQYIKYVLKIQSAVAFISLSSQEGKVLALPEELIYIILSFIDIQDKRDVMTKLCNKVKAVVSQNPDKYCMAKAV